MDNGKFCDELGDFLEEEGYSELDVQIDEEDTFLVTLDNPSVNNYNDALELVENFFKISNKYHIEDFEIDGDYESSITLLLL